VRIDIVDYQFGPGAHNRLDAAGDPSQAGAVAALETFYYALNNADAETLSAVWSAHPLAQLNNPLGGILRSGSEVTQLYRQIFAGRLKVQVTFGDAATYVSPESVTFAGREIGSYRADGVEVPLRIRTSRVFGYQVDQDAGAGRWLQVHHHGSIDELARYQRAAGRR